MSTLDLLPTTLSDYKLADIQLLDGIRILGVNKFLFGWLYLVAFEYLDRESGDMVVVNVELVSEIDNLGVKGWRGILIASLKLKV